MDHGCVWISCELARLTGGEARRLKPAALLEPTRAVRAVGFSPRASRKAAQFRSGFPVLRVC